jgi:hypothetical protein
MSLFYLFIREMSIGKLGDLRLLLAGDANSLHLPPARSFYKEISFGINGQ